MKQDLPVRLIAMDLDGTLLTHGSDGKARIPEGNLMALKEAQARGIRLAIASGRMPDDAGFFAAQAGLDMSILSLNGGCVQHHAMGEIVSSSAMDPVAALAVWRRACAEGMITGVFREHELSVTQSLSEAETSGHWGTHLYDGSTRCRVYGQCEGAEEMLRSGANKLVVITQGRPQSLAELRNWIDETYPQLEVSSSWYNNIEIGPHGVNKGTGLRALAERLGIPMAQVMALGDNSNDVPMLEAAACSVAMGNGTPDAKAAAAYIAPHFERDGVAAAIRSLAFGEETEGVVKA